MINSIHYPQPDEQEEQWSALVRLKQDFITFAKTYFREVEDKEGARIDIILIEQTIEDRIALQEKRLLEFFNEDRRLPITDFYKEFIERK